MPKFTKNNLLSIYETLYKEYGNLNWWPAETDFEVMIGAILTQNTAWSNVEKCIINLKPYLDPKVLSDMPSADLAEYIRPSGYYNMKAGKIKNFLVWFETYGFDIKNTEELSTEILRSELLSVNGVGRETANSILLYALRHRSFVIDAYTRRLFTRLGYNVPKDYDDFKAIFERLLPKDISLYNNYHAAIVIHCKDVCKAKPVCGKCIFNEICKFQKDIQER